MDLLAWAGILVGGLLLALVLLLAIPVELRLSVEHKDRTQATGRVRWLFGLVDVQILPRARPAQPVQPLPGPDRAPGDERGAAARTLGERIEDGRRRGRTLVAAWRTPGFTRALRVWLGRLLRSVHLRMLRGWLRFGTGDPAQTGQVFGYAQAALPASYLLEPAELAVQPDFHEAVFEAEGELRVRASPLRVLWVTLCFLATPATWRAAWSAHKAWRRA